MSTSEECWEWGGYTDRDGYGRWGPQMAHRRMYELLVGPVPRELQLDHLCRKRACVNPAHLEPVTPLVNSRRSAIARLPETCAAGHPWEAGKNGRFRRCRRCEVRWSRAYQARKKVA